jgi:hypothetical protein
MTRLVYLCGPVTGTTKSIRSDWRTQVRQGLPAGIVAIDPTRQKVEEIDETSANLTETEMLKLALHGRTVAQRDRFDVMRSDLLLANFLGAEARSIGSIGEIFWADAYRKPIIMVREHSGNPHQHAFLDALAGWLFHDLDAAVRCAIEVLDPTSHFRQ